MGNQLNIYFAFDEGRHFQEADTVDIDIVINGSLFKQIHLDYSKQYEQLEASMMGYLSKQDNEIEISVKTNNEAYKHLIYGGYLKFGS